METDASYWALHQWLFDAYRQGLQDGEAGQMRHSFALTWVLGPGWQEEEEKLWHEPLMEQFKEHLSNLRVRCTDQDLSEFERGFTAAGIIVTNGKGPHGD